MKHPILSLTIVVAISMLVGCAKEDDPKTRNFLMGFTAYPYGGSPESMEFAYSKLSNEADIINYRFDKGVPWEASLNGEEYDAGFMDDWSFRKSRANAAQKMYVSVTPINFLHNGLAVYRETKDNGPIPSGWDAYAFNDERVKRAYLNYCQRVIDFFHPDYFAMSTEANLLYFFRPEAWTEYLELHEYVYHQLKVLYPDLPVFSSVAGAPLLEGFLEGNDHVQQRLAVMQLQELSDFYAISFRPHFSVYNGNGYPENTFDQLFSMSTKPVIVAETGYTAEPFSMATEAGISTIETDPVKQQKFLEDLLAASETWKAEFIIWFTLRDHDQLWAQLGSSVERGISWRDAGLYDENGNPRPALNSWKEWLMRRVEN